MYEAGIKTVEDIFNKRHNVFYTFQEVKNKYLLQNSNFLNYYTIIKCISHAWKQILKTNTEINTNQELSLLQQLKTLKSANKMLYNKQLNEIHTMNTIKPKIKWEDEIGEINWKLVNLIPFRCLIDTKLRTFQYKYIMRIIPNNKFLYKCNINNTSLCDFCSMHVETNKHLFWDCHVTRAFWTDFHNFLNSKRIVIELSYKNISFGTNDWSSNTNIINCIIIIAKYFIFKTKYEKNLLSFNNFKKYLKYIENVEHTIAMSTDKYTQHRQKWENLQLNEN